MTVAGNNQGGAPKVLTTFLKETKAATVQADLGDYFKLDMEAFCQRMSLVRGWALEKAMSKWRELVNTPTVKRDMKGPVDFPLRLYVDPGLAVAEFQRVGTEQREEKCLRDTWQTRNISAESRDDVAAELTRGHANYASDSAAGMAGQSSNFAEPLAAGAFTQIPSMQSEDRLYDMSVGLCRSESETLS